MNQDPRTALPCICAENAPNDVRCTQECIELAELRGSAAKHVDRMVRAFDERPTLSNGRRARDAYAAALEASQVLLRRTRACLEFVGQIDEIEDAIVHFSGMIDEIDRMSAEYESERAPKQDLRDQKQERRHRSATARTGLRSTRRVIRWLGRQ